MLRENIVKLLRDLQLLDPTGQLLQLDSLSIVDLSLELEDAMEITIPPDSLVPENFTSVEAMVALVEQLRAGSA